MASADRFHLSYQFVKLICIIHELTYFYLLCKQLMEEKNTTNYSQLRIKQVSIKSLSINCRVLVTIIWWPRVNLLFYSTKHTQEQIHCNFFLFNPIASPHICYYGPWASWCHSWRIFSVACKAHMYHIIGTIICKSAST